MNRRGRQSLRMMIDLCRFAETSADTAHECDAASQRQ